MATLSMTVAGDIAYAILKNYAKGKALLQTIQERPLMRMLDAGKKTFGGGNLYLSDPVQGAFMSDAGNLAGQSATLNPGGVFFQGYSNDDQLQFAQANNLLRAEVQWYEVHAGLVISWTELKKDGISITDGGGKTEHADIALTRLTSLLENRMDDFGESWARSMNTMMWGDGTQDAKQVPGITSILTDTPAVGLTAGLNRATYSWWRHRTKLGIVPSGELGTLAFTMRQEQRQLTRFGGKPNKFLCGSAYLDALDSELTAKGMYTMDGWSKSKNDIGMADIALRGVGTFEYDPTLDDMGLAKYCFEFDTRRLRMRPMEGEENKVVNPERPYQYMVFLKSMTNTLGLQPTQLNCHGVYSVA